MIIRRTASLTRAITRALTQPITRALTAPMVGGGVAPFSVSSVFAGGRKGVYYSYEDKANLFTDSARTTPVSVATDLIGSATDLSGNGYHAAQTGVIRPAWNNGRAEFTSGDYLKAANVDFSGTDVVTFVAAVYKVNDTSGTALMEHGVGSSTTLPGARMTGPPYSTGGGFGALSRGTGLASAQNAPNSPAPIYAVVTIICRISTDTCIVRVNGVVGEVAITDQGTGTYQLADLFIGAGAAGTNLWFGSNHYQNLAIDKELTEVELNNVEKAFGASVGVTIGAPKFTIAAMGDSFTYAVNGGVTANQAFVKQLDTRLARIVYSANLGQSGHTTSNMMGRRWQLLRIATPNMATIYGSINDLAGTTTVAASPTPTSTVFTLTSAAGHDVDGWITVGGVQAQVLSVVGSVITLTTPLAGGAPTAGASVTIDTQKNLTELALYVKNAGCKRIMMLGLHYYNTVGGGADTTSVEVAANATLRAKQQAAAAAAGVVYVDLYAWQRALIIAGTRTQGNYAEHVSSSDPHLSLLGQTTIADAIEATITAQGWT